jgi:hypothetical protein
MVIESFVSLTSQRLHSGSLTHIEHAYLQKIMVGRYTHLTAESVYFSHKMSFCSAAYRRIARHKSNGVKR